ncbi:maleylacetoacetate isomerase [Psychrobium sp. MM17-31]|nr:maleylacetoacetate isomerase [Psychrobium sp. MM17-31]MCG7530058.1 maleylacetoacetate isomerase [Psychrobium sp. MM17-31]
MILHGYWRSSAAYRVRIVLNLLDLTHEHRSVHLVKNGGEQHLNDYDALNPSHLVPTLEDKTRYEPVVITQSMAIIEYLDEVFGESSLVGKSPLERALIRSLAQDICCDIHPLNNLRVVQHLGDVASFEAEDKATWMRHWMTTGFSALEKKLAKSAGKFCVGNEVSLVDVCLIPQLYNAHRFGLSLDDYPTIAAIEKRCLALDAFANAVPEKQADAS